LIQVLNQSKRKIDQCKQEWLSQNLERIQSEAPGIHSLTFYRFAHSFYLPDSEFVKLQNSSGNENKASTLATNQSYLENHVLPFFGDMKLKDISGKDIDDFLIELSRKKIGNKGRQRYLSASTRNHCLSVLKDILEFATKKRFIPSDPTQYAIHKTVRQKQQKKVVLLSQDEIDKLFFHGDSLSVVWKGRTRYYTISLLAAFLGSRQSELLGLQLKHVFPDHYTIEQSFYRSYGISTPKTTKSSRHVPLTPFLYSKIKEQIDSIPFKKEASTFLFYGETPEMPMGYRHITTALSDALVRIGIPKIDQERRGLTFHSLRKQAITFLLSKGIPEHEVRAIMGHENIEMTDRYTHYEPEHFSKVIQTLADSHSGVQMINGWDDFSI
jgi:integrase